LDVKRKKTKKRFKYLEYYIQGNRDQKMQIRDRMKEVAVVMKEI